MYTDHVKPHEVTYMKIYILNQQSFIFQKKVR